MGKGALVEKRVLIRKVPHKGWSIGEGLYLGQGAIIDVEQGATLRVGSNVKFMHYTLLAAAESVRVDNDVQVAEFTSIRDQNHDTSKLDMLRSVVVTRPISIGCGAWIARGAAILAGSTIGAGAVVAANAVVAGTEVPELGIAGGVPARIIGSRTVLS